MGIIKEWYKDGVVDARLHRTCGKYYLDYKFCIITVELRVEGGAVGVLYRGHVRSFPRYLLPEIQMELGRFLKDDAELM